MAASHFAPLELISVISVACLDGSPIPGAEDPDLADGTHLRVYAGLGRSFPLAPFAVYRAKGVEGTIGDIRVSGGVRIDESSFQIDDGTPAEVTLHLPDPGDLLVTGVTLDAPGGELQRVELLDQRGRTVVVREAPAVWSFSAPRPHRLRVTGRAGVVNVRISALPFETVIGLRQAEPEACIGLPLVGTDGGWEPSEWYAALHGRTHGLRAVDAGAPKRLTPMDRPDGNLAQPDTSSEVARIDRAADADFIERLSRMVRDGQRPWDASLELLGDLNDRGKSEPARIRTCDLMQLAVTDPGMARFLGFAAETRGRPPISVDAGSDWDSLVVVGAVAWDPAWRDFEPPPADDFADDILMLLAKGISSVPVGAVGRQQDVNEAAGVVKDLIDRAIGKGLDARLLVAATASFPPGLAPEMPEPVEVLRIWDAPQEDAASETYGVAMTFPQSPLASLCALGRDDGTGYVTTHAKVENLTAHPDWRAKPRLMGRRTRQVLDRSRIDWTVYVDRPEGLLADGAVPAAGTVSYLASASDAFGRFGKPATVVVDPPERPVPPPPALAWDLEMRVPPPPGTDPESPGTLGVRLIVQTPGADRAALADLVADLGSQLLVPSVRDLAPGSLPIAAIEFAIDGVALPPVDVSRPGPAALPPVALAKLAPCGSGSAELAARYIDEKGRKGAWARQRIAFHDQRPPEVFLSAKGLYWTSAPGPSPEVEILLEWPAAKHVGYRVYRAGPLAFLPAVEATTPRGRVAGDVLASGARPGRDLFGLLPGEAVVKDGKARFAARLSGSLWEVSLLRVVPHGPTGAEPDFEHAPVIAVAVPDSRRPAPPLLSGSVDPDTGTCRIDITADRFDLMRLRAEEPALFGDGPHGDTPPTFRLRRAVGPVSDPVFARVVAPNEPLQLKRDDDGTPTHFAASLELERPLLPFVRYVFWADVRLPPERRFRPDVPPEHQVEETEILAPDKRATEPHPRPFSFSSPPLQLMYAPPPPAAPEEAAATREADGAGFQLRIGIGEAPATHPKAVGRYRLAVWMAEAGGDIAQVRTADGAWPVVESGEVILPLPGGEAPAKVWVALVDPLERIGSVGEANIA